MAHWGGNCPRRETQLELCKYIEKLAEVSHSFYEISPEIKRFDNNKIRGIILLKPDLIEDTLLIQHGVKMEETEEETWEDKTELVKWPVLSEADLFGIEFHLYDPRDLYEDRMSFVFLSHEIPVLNGLIVMVEDHNECAYYTSKTIQNADWYLTNPKIHLRYYLERWFDYLMGWIKYFFMPDLWYWRYGDMPGYDNVKETFDKLMSEVENERLLKEIVFEDILDRFEFEVVNWAEADVENYRRVKALISKKRSDPILESTERPPIERIEEHYDDSNENVKKLIDFIRKSSEEMRKEGIPVTDDGRLDMEALKGIYPPEEIERKKRWVAAIDRIRYQRIPYLDKLQARIRASKYNYDALWFCRGIDLAALERYNEALRCFDMATNVDPDFDRAFFHKGMVLACLDRYDEALICFDKVIQLNPNDYKAWFQKGMTLQKIRKFDEALHCLNMAIQINSSDPDVWYLKCLVLGELGKYEEMLHCVDSLMQINPNDNFARKLKEKILAGLKSGARKT